MAPSWVKELIGIPFVDRGRSRQGGDCWNVVQLGLKTGWGIEVPGYTEHYETTSDREEIARLVSRESLGWIPVPLAQAQPGDVLFLRILGNECHAGLIVEPPWFLHAIRGACSCLERWDAAIWEHRISAVYRHPALQTTQEGVALHEGSKTLMASSASSPPPYDDARAMIVTDRGAA